MPGFTKLFSDIVDSSIWEEDSDIRIVWVTLLALADESGFVRGSVGWLASKAKVSEEVCTRALALFESPDRQSRTTDNEGRRLKTAERGWLILNYSYFRNEHNQLSHDPRKAYKREWMRKKRAESLSTGCPQKSTGVHPASVSVQGTGGLEGVQGESQRQSPQGNGTAPIAIVSERLCKMFKRTSGIRAYDEQYALAEVCRRPGVLEELTELEQRKPDAQYFPWTMRSLLEGWDKALDSIRNQPKGPPSLIEKRIQEI